jgi:hypothetical protein
MPAFTTTHLFSACSLRLCALCASGRTFKAPTDYGFMYGQSFQDPDGHIWEWIWMDSKAIKEG